MISQEEYMMTIDHFLNKPEVRILLICITPAGLLIPSNTFPETFKTKTIYFVKRQVYKLLWHCRNKFLYGISKVAYSISVVA